MECEVEVRRAELGGGDVVAPLRTMGAAMLGSVGDGRGDGTALRGAGGWGSLGAAIGTPIDIHGASPVPKSRTTPKLGDLGLSHFLGIV